MTWRRCPRCQDPDAVEYDGMTEDGRPVFCCLMCNRRWTEGAGPEGFRATLTARERAKDTA